MSSQFLENLGYPISKLYLEVKGGKLNGKKYEMDPRLIDHSGELMSLLYTQDQMDFLEDLIVDGVLTLPTKELIDNRNNGENVEYSEANIKYINNYIKQNPETYYRILNGQSIPLLSDDDIKDSISPNRAYTSRLERVKGGNTEDILDILEQQLEDKKTFIPIVEDDTNANLDNFGKKYLDLPKKIQKVLDPLKESPPQWGLLLNLANAFKILNLQDALLKQGLDVIKNFTREDYIKSGFLPENDQAPESDPLTGNSLIDEHRFIKQ